MAAGTGSTTEQVGGRFQICGYCNHTANRQTGCFFPCKIHIQERASQARDLGLDVSSARKPTRRTMAKRWVKAGRRTRRCARFGRWASKQATARLWRTGAWAQKAYGTAAMGAPPSWVKQARTRAAEAAQCGGRGRFLTTAIALLHPKADPAVQVPCNLIRQWLIFWEHSHRLRPYIGKVWAKIATAMMASFD